MILEIKNLHVYYGAIRALKEINLNIDQNEIVTVLGANGAGKSTLLRTITGLVAPRQGEIRYEGGSINTVAPHMRVPMGIAMVPEGRGIFPNLTVQENLLLGAFPFRKEGLKGKTGGLLEKILNDFPVLRGRRSQAAGTLSGGEQQMLSIGRALLARPRLLLLDEPSMGLSPILVSEIFKMLPRIKEQGTAILLVEQNANAALKVADRGYVLDMGQITYEDTAQGLTASEEVRAAYLS
jgi:branched-chain amino acid transport system ATP-binding protein